MPRRANLKSAINTLLVPALRERGFVIAGDGEEAPTWAEGRFFRRVREGREEVVFIGRDKFGPAVAFSIARAKQDGSYAYMDWHNRGLTRERLRFQDDEGLDDLLLYLIRYFDEAVTLWFDSVN